KGWRPIFLAGVAPLAAIPLLKIVPESSMFLEEAAKPEKPPISNLFRGEYLRRTLMLWVHWFVIVMAYWGVFLWFPKILVAQRGLTLVKSLQWSFLITLAQIPGYWSGAWVIERLGRKASLSLYMGMAGLGALLYWFASTPTQALAGAVVLSFFNLGAWGITYAYTPELYPTSLRGLGSGAANSFGRLGGILGPYLVGAILDATGSYSLAFLTFGAAQLLSASVVAALGVETAGRPLEEVSPGG
ncbi:MAG: MFS transporter, partial [Candidatus Korarchaeota archaeon]|nr:MFS transporter [Candidatus Korarchaeota archaeon]